MGSVDVPVLRGPRSLVQGGAGTSNSTGLRVSLAGQGRPSCPNT